MKKHDSATAMLQSRNGRREGYRKPHSIGLGSRRDGRATAPIILRPSRAKAAGGIFAKAVLAMATSQMALCFVVEIPDAPYHATQLVGSRISVHTRSRHAERLPAFHACVRTAAMCKTFF